MTDGGGMCARFEMLQKKMEQTIQIMRHEKGKNKGRNQFLAIER